MSDRIKGYIVTLDGDYKEEDAVEIRNAIRMIKSVLNVESNVTDINDHMNRNQIKNELRNKLWEILE